MDSASNLNLAQAGPDFLQSSFFVYDDYHKDEMARDEDLILFFHPQNVDIYKYAIFASGTNIHIYNII
jgi:hypothetical protein